LNGMWGWDSNSDKSYFKNKKLVSMEIHSKYPTVQVWKYIDEYGIQERIIIPGMEEWFIE